MPELTRRYIVMAMAAEAPFDLEDPEAPFVLKPWKDPAALEALEAYRDLCYPELAADLTAWIGSIRSGAPLRGGVGARNEEHMATQAKARPAAARPRPAPAAKTKAKIKARAKSSRPSRAKKKGRRRS
jgi:hypothetical protein